MKKLAMLFLVGLSIFAFGAAINELKTNSSNECAQTIKFTGDIYKGATLITEAAIQGSSSADSTIAYVNTGSGTINWARVSKSGAVATDVSAIASTYLDTDTTLAANSNTKIATQAATKYYVNNFVGSSNITTLGTIGTGTWNATAVAWNKVNKTGAVTSDITSDTNNRYVTDAQLVVIGHTSNTNTGDETNATIKSKLVLSFGYTNLTSGTATITTAAVTDTANIFLTPQTLGPTAKVTSLSVSTITAGASFVITSSDATDTSRVSWLLLP